jgi:hypothetical protein
MLSGWLVATHHSSQNIAHVHLSRSWQGSFPWQWTVSTKIFVKYFFRDIPEAKDVKSCFINDTALKIHSSTYKILHDKLQQIFSDDSVSENDDDPENRGKTRNDGNDTLQGRIQVRNKVQIYKKPNMVSVSYL